MGACGSLWEPVGAINKVLLLHRIVGESHLDTVIAREEIVVVLFIDESTPLLNVALKNAGRELELTFGLVVIDVTDIQGIQV